MYLLIAIICGLFAIAASVFAQEGATTSARPTAQEREERQLLLQDRIEAHRADVEVKRAALEERRTDATEHRAALSDARQTRLATFIKNFQDRVLDATEKLWDIHDRIETRAQELALRGVDVAITTEKLREAEAKLTEVTELLAGIDTNVEYALTSDEPKTDLAELRTLFGTIRDLLKETRELLREAVAALKDAVVDASLGRGASDAVSADDTSGE